MERLYSEQALTSDECSPYAFAMWNRKPEHAFRDLPCIFANGHDNKLPTGGNTINLDSHFGKSLNAHYATAETPMRIVCCDNKPSRASLGLCA